MRPFAIALIGFLVSTACQSRPPEREPTESARVALRQGESVHDSQGSASLIVKPLEEKPEADGPRHLAIRWVVGDKTIDLGTLADARLVDRAVVALGTDGVLQRIGEGGEKREIDRNAHSPLSVRGHTVAYVRGEPPMLELAVADLEKGEPTALAPDWLPAWCPAIAEDGSIVFVTGRAGTAQIARVVPGAEPRVIIAQPDAFPEGPDAPKLVSNQLSFYFRGAEKTLSLGEVR